MATRRPPRHAVINLRGRITEVRKRGLEHLTASRQPVAVFDNRERAIIQLALRGGRWRSSVTKRRQINAEQHVTVDRTLAGSVLSPGALDRGNERLDFRWTIKERNQMRDDVAPKRLP